MTLYPNHWEVKTVDEVCQFSNGHGFRPPDWSKSGLPIIRIQNLNGSREYNYFSGNPENDWLVEPGTILFAWAGTKGVSFGPTIWNGSQGVLNQHIYRIHPNDGIDKKWLYLILQIVTVNIERKAHGFKTTLVHVRKADITGQVIGVPPLAEQRKIVAILRAWDEAIAAAERLVATLWERKRGLMQRLLIPHSETEQPATRFPGFTAPWRLEELGRVFARVTRKNSVRNTNVLTASGEHGLVSQTTYFKRSVAGEGIENYYLLHRGEFAYNRSSSEGYPYGAIKQLEGYDAGILSTLYLCFRLADESYDANFYRHFFEAGGLNRGIYSIAQEGARNHGLLNVSVSDFFGLSVPVPEPVEQRRLAAFFDTVAAEIDLAVQHAERLRQQKRGLMQRLLTGQVRVQVDDGAVHT